MKTIGFIDYYLDEWHANKYPQWIEDASGGELKVTCAYGLADAPGGRTNADWARDMGIELLSSIEEVIARTDYLIVLSPDHPEYHEELAQLPLRSGKPTYIDKTFAPDRATALRLFELADKHGTPLFSSSALRFAPEYKEAAGRPIDMLFSQGPGRYANYAVHQLEPIIMLMGADPSRIMSIGTEQTPSLLIGYPDGRQAVMAHLAGGPFRLAWQEQEGQAAAQTAEADFFASFIEHLVQFFQTGRPPVDPAETIAIMTCIEHGAQAMKTPHQWIELPAAIRE
ncbi:Gfo/Idh/MocA family protein [Paenibacillus sp. 1P07SE]|uniref:Gfo/Idh/MocA family protein n=1 Tax=Paenibacillus sp. 1P07SE TaxID=3132209 RepID=UPI0039A65499